MKVQARKLTARQALKLFEAFVADHGPEAIKNAYGWDTAADGMAVGGRERVWAFTDAEHTWEDALHKEPLAMIVGWGALDLNTSNAHDDEAVLSVGVFKAWERRGYRTAILDWMSKQAKRLGADSVSMIVKKSNEAHHARTIREAKTDGSPWIYAGDVWYPAPGYSYFVRPLDT